MNWKTTEKELPLVGINNASLHAINVTAGNITIDYSPKVLQVVGLGSCIAVAFYNKPKKLGGLAHVVLPSSDRARTPQIKGKYADSAIKELIALFQRKKARLENTVVKITGGSNMFSNLNKDVFDIGKKNYLAVEKELKKYNLKIARKDIGGNKGRSIYFNLDNGEIKIFLSGQQLRMIL
ncbi:MAG: chemotaxis protein CheD [Candidatus Hodarchaeota archaeon]